MDICLFFQSLVLFSPPGNYLATLSVRLRFFDLLRPDWCLIELKISGNSGQITTGKRRIKSVVCTQHKTNPGISFKSDVFWMSHISGHLQFNGREEAEKGKIRKALTFISHRLVNLSVHACC